MNGGWRGPMQTVGGMPRTYGLQDHFSKPDQDGVTPRIARGHIKRISAYFKPYWKEWLVILMCVAAHAGLSILPPFCVAAILDSAIPHSDSRLLALMAFGMVALAIASGLIGVLEQSLTARAGQSIMCDLRNELFRHLQAMSLDFYTRTRSGEIVSRINNDVNAVQGVASRTLVAIVSNLMTLIATSVALIMMNWKLALLAVMVTPCFYLPSIAVGRVRRKLAAETQESQASLLAFMQERLHVGGALLTKIFGQAPADAAAFEKENERIRDLNIRQTVVGRWLFMVLSVFSVVGPALVFWYGGLQVINGSLSLGQLVAFAALLTLLYKPLMQLATVYVDVQASVAVFDRIFEYLDMVPGVKDKPDARKLEQVHGRLQFKNVSFAYPRPPAQSDAKEENGETPAAPKLTFTLRDINFEISPGERVALVGPSGAGKTTITYLAPRFYDPTEGDILLDGQNLRDINQDALRQHIGIVTQETCLFHTTIRENLLYARTGATQDQIEAACRAANIHDFIVGLPQGYDTVVGERGFRLSGGEKQRVSIARALLKNPSLLILDEATSSLDATSEFLVQEALEKLLQNRTSLIIAHRLSTILSSDKIVVLEKGRLVESGRHEDLLEKDGLYAKLFKQQFAKVLKPDEVEVAE